MKKNGEEDGGDDDPRHDQRSAAYPVIAGVVVAFLNATVTAQRWMPTVVAGHLRPHALATRWRHDSPVPEIPALTVAPLGPTVKWAPRTPTLALVPRFDRFNVTPGIKRMRWKKRQPISASPLACLWLH